MRYDDGMGLMTSTLTASDKAQRVLHQLMEQRQAIEIGERIRELRNNSEETNGSVADYCNVRERTVAGWVAGEGISYKNAKRVAELFQVDIDWLWRGRRSSPLDALSAPVSQAELDERLGWIESALEALLSDRGVEHAAPPSERVHLQRTGSSGEDTRNG